MKQSFLSQPQELLKKANAGQDPLWLEILDSTKGKVGFGVTHIDNTYFAARRLIIIHFTVSDRSLYEEKLK
jgi:hypothetical protein